MRDILIEKLPGIPVSRQRLELVERKGIGHPDTICDAIMEAVSVELSRLYIEKAGRVLHHNIDKGLLVAGQTSPALGGGTIERPMQLIFGDRATTLWNDHRIDLDDILVSTAHNWLKEHLRFVDPSRHIIIQNEIQSGSAQLMDIFNRETISANDTSAAVGYAPMSATEQTVLAAERYLNSPEFKKRFPESGEDIKVMGARRGRKLSITVAMAFVDRFVTNEKSYFEKKEAIKEALMAYLKGSLKTLNELEIDINTLDSPGRELGGMYLTVLGTSAEGADCGQVGRGNRVNGVISVNRPLGTEAAAGKNPAAHVGKIYSVLTHKIADHIYKTVSPVEEVYVWLCSQIGRPIHKPWVASAQVILKEGSELSDVRPAIEEIIHRELSDMKRFTRRLAHGEFRIC